MNMAKRTLLDELADPASWAGAPMGFAPPNEIYRNARLMDAKIYRNDLVVTVYSGGEQFSTTLCDESFEKLTAEQVVEMLTPYIGELLLTALAHEIDSGD